MAASAISYIPRNPPREQADAIARQLIDLPRPKPIDPAVQGDDLRFDAELLSYQKARDELLQEKRICDELARTVDMAIPSKRREFLTKFFKIMENTDEGRAFIARFGKPKLMPKKGINS